VPSQRDSIHHTSVGPPFGWSDLQVDWGAGWEGTASNQAASVRIHHTGPTEFGKFQTVIEGAQENRDLERESGTESNRVLSSRC
jgi:hypothetical protein